MLHSHFVVAPNEALLEVTDERARVQVTKVVPIDQVGAEQAATWRFTPDGYPRVAGWCATKNGGAGGYH